nr:helix-turn-helix transcriptional regulator [Planctomycetota bacterium]
MPIRSGIPLAPLPKVAFAGHYDSAQPTCEMQVPFHTHATSELVVVTGGSCHIDVGDRALMGHLGTVFVLPQGVPHNQIAHGAAKTTYVVYQTTALSFPDDARAIDLSAGDPALGWIEDIWRLANAATGAPDALLGALLLAFLERLKSVEHRSIAARALPGPLAKAVRFLEDNLMESLEVARIAAAGGVSPSHLTTLFRTHYGCGPLKFQQRLRLALAGKLLRNSYLSVSEVAAACGYQDANYFSRLFRAHFAETPLHWRRGLLQDG